MENVDSPLLEIEIADLARGGAGVGKAPDGRAIFVPLTAPGDRVRVRIVKADKRYATAELVELQRPSEIRVTPRCPVFGRCGGCEWQHLPYEFQWKTKVGGIAHALKRVGFTELPKIEELPATGVEWNYRNRVQMRGIDGQAGFFGRKSREMVAVERCDIARPEINAVLAEVRAEGARLPREYKVEVEVLENGEIRKSWNARHAAGGFRQVHDSQNVRLQAWVASAIPDGAVVLDLYGGAGNLTLGLAARVGRVECVDVGAPKSPPAGTPPNYRYHRMPVARWLKQRGGPANSAAPGTHAILDPPREGIAEDFAVVAEGLARQGVRELVLVGCDVDAWARDLSRFSKKGWKPVRLGALDLFPQTHHVESLAVLSLDFSK